MPTSSKPDGTDPALAKSRSREEKLAAIRAAVEDFQRHATDLRPVTKEEWDEINDDTD